MAGEVFVAVPWRDRGNTHAQESLDYVIEHLYSILHQPVHLVDSPEGPWSLAAARNRAVREAHDAEADVVVICDADTIVEADALLRAVELAADCGRIVLPYTLFRALTPASSSAVISGIDPRAVPDGGRLDWSVGGVQVAQPDTWARAGWQDERFTMWGCEDTAFALAAARLVGPHERVDGVISHLWHPVTWKHDDPATIANSQLLIRYSEATTVEQMRALTQEWQ